MKSCHFHNPGIKFGSCLSVYTVSLCFLPQEGPTLQYGWSEHSLTWHTQGKCMSPLKYFLANPLLATNDEDTKIEPVFLLLFHCPWAFPACQTG